MFKENEATAMKKHLIILEGIATSGKSTVLHALAAALKTDHTIKMVTEDETLMGLVENQRLDVAERHLRKLLDQFLATQAEIVLVDRFHLTHLFRTGSTLKDIAALEETLLLEFDPQIFLLVVDDQRIPERVQDARNRRGSWLGKSGTLAQKCAYYRNQQEILKALARTSRIPVTVIDTTAMDWPSVTKRIIEALSLP